MTPLPQVIEEYSNSNEKVVVSPSKPSKMMKRKRIHKRPRIVLNDPNIDIDEGVAAPYISDSSIAVNIDEYQ